MTSNTSSSASFNRSTWLRVSIYDQPKLTDELFHLGTLYGKGPDILGSQIAKILRNRWKLSSWTLKIDRQQYRLKIPVHSNSDLLLEFTTPGIYSHRARAQWFGLFVRAVSADPVKE